MHPADVQYMQDPVNRADFIAAADLRDSAGQLVRTFPTTDAVQRAHNIIVNVAHQERPDTSRIDLNHIVAQKVSLKLETALQMDVSIGIEGKTLTYPREPGSGLSPEANAARIADLIRRDIPDDKDIVAAYLHTSVTEVITTYDHQIEAEFDRSEYEGYDPATEWAAEDDEYAEYLEKGEAYFNPAPLREPDQLPESLRLARLNFPDTPATEYSPTAGVGNGLPPAGPLNLHPNAQGIGR
jgi:hypothetical protein